MSFHVIPAGARWALRRTGAKRASYIFSRRQDAWGAARRRAQKDRATAYLHDAAGPAYYTLRTQPEGDVI